MSHGVSDESRKGATVGHTCTPMNRGGRKAVMGISLMSIGRAGVVPRGLVVEYND